jgi:hypothetical protein
MRLMQAIGVGFIVLMTARLLGVGTPQLVASVEMRSKTGSTGELFFAAAREEYDPKRSVTFPLSGDSRWHTYQVSLPNSGALARLRIDPGGSEAGPVEIRKVSLQTTGNTVVLEGNMLKRAVAGLNMLQSIQGNDANLHYRAVAPDPYVSLQLPPNAGATSRLWMWITVSVVGLVAGLLWWLISYGWARFAIGKRFTQRKASVVLQRIAAAISDEHVLVVTPEAVVVVLATLAGAMLYVTLHLHQSSIGVWEEIYPASPVKQLVDLGTPKRIRSDEWNTQTPWVLGQVSSGMRERNLSIGGEEAPLLASVPTIHSSSIAQGKFYGFYLFDAEGGFSWWWAYKTFVLLLSFFWLFLLLTRGGVLASVLGSIWIYGSSSTQWWLSSYSTELLIAFALATTGAIYLMFARRRIMMGIGAALVAYSVLNLLLNLYPPTIVALAFLGAAILISLILEPGRFACVRTRLGWRVFFLGLAAMTIGIIGGNYLMDAMPSIEAMASTVYPGRRVSESGGFPLVRLLYGFFEVFRISEDRLPLPPTNASEASSFIILSPLLLLALPFSAFVRRKNALFTALLIYSLVVGLWICVPLPHAIESVMQMLGWGRLPPQRAVIGFGIGSIIACTVLMSRIQEGFVEVRPEPARWMVPILVFSCLLLFGWVLNIMDPQFFQLKIILAGSLSVSVMAAGIVLGRPFLLAAGLAVVVAPALLVNPLVSGLSAIEKKPVLLAAKRQGGAAGDRWAVVGDFIFSQGLKAHGLNVITGSQLIPNRETARVLDPSGKYVDIWNRYAHVVLRSDPGRSLPMYELVVSDVYVVGLDVCGPSLRQLGVTHVAYTGAVPAPDLRCLQPLYAPTDSGVRLFRLSQGGRGSR